MLLGTLGASFLGNLLTDKIKIRTGQGTIRAGKGTIRAGQDCQCHLILLISEYKRIIKMNLNLVVLIQEIIYLEYRMGHV